MYRYMAYFSMMSDIKLFTYVCIVSIIISIFAIFLVKTYIPLHIRYKDNAVIGNTTALISIIYGVFSGLTALYLINNISYTNDAVQHEANAIANLYRDSKWLNNHDVQISIKKDVITYLNQDIDTEWPQMESGQLVQDNNDTIIDRISSNLKTYSLSNQPGNIAIPIILDEIKNLYDARHQRINMSYSMLNPEIWILLFIGTILTLCINYLFGVNFYLHIITVVAAALMTSSMIFLILSLDRPFQGEFIIQPRSLQLVLDYINHQK